MAMILLVAAAPMIIHFPKGKHFFFLTLLIEI